MSDTAKNDKRILIVEDDDVITRIISEFLSDYGFEISTADDGMKGLIKWREFHPDLAIIDILMPRLNGIDLIKKAKDEELLKETKVIVISALTQVDKVREAIASGANDYIRKPLEFDILLNKLENQLNIKLAKDEQNQYLFYNFDKQPDRLIATIKGFLNNKELISFKFKLLQNYSTNMSMVVVDMTQIKNDRVESNFLPLIFNFVDQINKENCKISIAATNQALINSLQAHPTYKYFKIHPTLAEAVK